MDNQFTDIDLCEALSTIFVDNEVDYEEIASIVKYFSIEHVEIVFFEWVAPVCYINDFTPVPYIWTFFEREQLWEDIQSFRKQRVMAGGVGKIKTNIKLFLLRKYFQDDWKKLKRSLTVLSR
ncbi:DUF7079 family protein [Xenorhabdus bharatensis]|uniref:DUF7079 family protein n=1 Tax=Xenorhabdus bharatensis TaxID=3136256 RepID=UPI0030F39F12